MAIGFSTIAIIVKRAQRMRALAKTYIQLFGSKEEIDVLNSAAPTTAGLLQQSLLESMVLSIGRMLDPTGGGKRANLSLERVIKDLPDNSEYYENRRKVMVDEFELLLSWRNNFYAHKDANLAYSLFHAFPGDEDEELPFRPIAAKDVLCGIDRVCALVADIEASLGVSSALADPDIEGPDGDSLIEALTIAASKP